MIRCMLCIILLTLAGCVQSQHKQETKKPHRYGGWYCPDNLKGFPPVDMAHWSNVPVISDRLPTQEETQTEASLMYIDPAEYPTAKTMDIALPQLARYYNEHTHKDEYIIVIQAVVIEGDSVLGFRYVNGGNGSAWYREVDFLSDEEIARIPDSRFVHHSIAIDATQRDIWSVLTDANHLPELQPTFEENVQGRANWRDGSNVNYHYEHAGLLTSGYADLLYGCYYVQNDYVAVGQPYVEKFLLVEKEEETTLHIVCGPYVSRYKEQHRILHAWAEKVKALSEELTD
mgnify:CR=1 FL=1